MNFVTAQTLADMKLDGITIDVERRDGALTAVTLTDASGHVLRIAKSDYSSMGAFIPAPPQKKTVHVVTGTVRTVGTPLREVFDEAYEASVRRSEIESSDVVENLSVATEEVEIPF